MCGPVVKEIFFQTRFENTYRCVPSERVDAPPPQIISHGSLSLFLVSAIFTHMENKPHLLPSS